MYMLLLSPLQVLYFKFPDNIDQVSVEALADNEACVYFSVQQNDVSET